MSEAERLRAHFDQEPTVDPVNGYPERDRKWFIHHQLPDFQLLVECDIDPSDQVLRIADVGCAYGYFTKEYARIRNVSVVGVDFSQERITKACAINSADNVTYFQHDITTGPISREPFDIVVTSAVLQHIVPTPNVEAYRNRAIFQIWNSLKRGGHFVLYESFREMHVATNWYDTWDGMTELLSFQSLAEHPGFRTQSLQYIDTRAKGMHVHRAHFIKE